MIMTPMTSGMLQLYYIKLSGRFSLMDCYSFTDYILILYRRQINVDNQGQKYTNDLPKNRMEKIAP